MSFCTLGSEYIMDTQTAVDNAFITEFLPDAPRATVAVYLYGLYLAGNIHNEDNSVDVMSRVLGLSYDDILDCYTYLEGFGFVCVVHKKPLEIKYLSLRSHGRVPLRKINPGKYKDFNTQIQMQIAGRMIEPNEYNEYYVFLEHTLMEPAALVMIAKYCVDLKGDTVGHHYILTVARSLAAANYKTVETIEEKLAFHSKHNPSIESVLKALGIRRSIDYEDRSLFQKWTAEFGFSEDIILKVAKSCKNKGGMKKLDTQLSEYYKLGLLTIKEIDKFTDEKESRYSLARAVNRAIGVYYESLDHIVETYIAVWKGHGFSDDILLEIAKYCFKQNIRTLDGMDAAVNKFHRMGLITKEAIAQHMWQLSKNDVVIRSLLETAGVVRGIASSDRISYKNWSESWNMPDEVILYAANLSRTADHPMQFLNRILSNYKSKGIRTLIEAKADNENHMASPMEKNLKKTTNPVHNYPQHEYTKEELDALFDDIDTIQF